MNKFAACLAGLLLLCGLGFCTREDGLPDPPRQELVPCRADAADDDPLACPATEEGDTDADTQPEVDAGV